MSLSGVVVCLWLGLTGVSSAAMVTGQMLDAADGKPVAARLYIQSDAGEWFFAESIGGIAVRYAKTNWVNPRAMEVHTTLTSNFFRVELPPGRYTFTAERGKEYHPLTQAVVVASEPLAVKLPLHRWVNMAQRGWFSGDGHVHRTLAELPTLLLAEDLNVALPQSFWAIQDGALPTPSNKFFGNQTPEAIAAAETNATTDIPAQLIQADATHVIWPMNTEYEIFKVGSAMHNLGAVFILNHRERFKLGAPPLRHIAEAAHRQGALLDMDKCNWNWSLMLPPIMGIDLYELANNHLWRTEYAITNFNVPAPVFMNLPDAGRSGGERDWINYTFNTYYTLLNCGFRMRPTAGTASGVHPVPLGFGRVYVHCPRGFTYDDWIKGLNAGRSFVTTGPMLLAEINGEVPGGKFTMTSGKSQRVKISGTVLSEKPVRAIEVIANGATVQTIPLKTKRNRDGAYEARFKASVKIAGTSWLALRCWEERDGGRIRFAHTAPSWFDDSTAPLRPRREEVNWLVERMKQEIATNTSVLSPEAVAEYQQALEAYQTLERDAR